MPPRIQENHPFFTAFFSVCAAGSEARSDEWLSLRCCSWRASFVRFDASAPVPGRGDRSPSAPLERLSSVGTDSLASAGSDSSAAPSSLDDVDRGPADDKGSVEAAQAEVDDEAGGRVVRSESYELGKEEKGARDARGERSEKNRAVDRRSWNASSIVHGRL